MLASQSSPRKSGSWSLSSSKRPFEQLSSYGGKSGTQQEQDLLDGSRQERIPSLSNSTSSMSSMSSVYNWTTLPEAEFSMTWSRRSDGIVDSRAASSMPLSILEDFPIPPLKRPRPNIIVSRASSTAGDVAMSASGAEAGTNQAAPSAPYIGGFLVAQRSFSSSRSRPAPSPLYVNPHITPAPASLLTPTIVRAPIPSAPPPIAAPSLGAPPPPPRLQTLSQRPERRQQHVNLADNGPLSPFPLSPGVYQPGTAGRERMAALMGLSPAPSTLSYPSSASTLPQQMQPLESPFRGKFMHIGRPPVPYHDEHALDPLHQLPPLLSPAGAMCLRLQPSGLLIVDYVGPMGELPWTSLDIDDPSFAP